MAPPLLALFAFLSLTLAAQPGNSVAIHVRETGGIRRSAFPVTARVPFPRGVLTDSAQTRLLLDGTETPSQTTTTARWPDGSVQWADVDFNASPVPNATLDFTLQYGPGVSAAAPGRGLTLTEEADAIQIGNVRFKRSASPLVASVKYREEAIAAGLNGLIIRDTARVGHDLSSAEDLKVEILKRGPLVATLRYSGTVEMDGANLARVARAVMTIEMPSSKSWVKFSAVVDDPSRQVGSVVLATPLALGPLPWVWDFGTSRWTYGSLRSADQSVAFDGHQKPTPEWRVRALTEPRLDQTVETSAPDNATFGGWGHLQGGKEVVAFALDGATIRGGTTGIGLSGGGPATFGASPTTPQTRHELIVYEHFVSTPVQIGAATSPAAILTPLVAALDQAQYTKAGVPAPSVVR